MRLAHAIVCAEAVGEESGNGAVVSLVTEALQKWTRHFFVGCDDAAVAAGDVFRSLEREAGDVADGADGFALIQRAPGLGAVFDQDKLMFIREGFQRS